ncbi:MAG TPA: NADP oxidoreductase [bacterium]
MGGKLKIATCSLAGCFGCHMSILDIDERILDLARVFEFNKTPLTDIKDQTECDIGIIEGGCANSDNVEVLREFRGKCKILVSIGDCATMGGVPAMRNNIPIRECLAEAFLSGPTVTHGIIPNDPEIPLMLNRVYPCNQVVRIDYHLPGCPPGADSIFSFLSALKEGRKLDSGKCLLK